MVGLRCAYGSYDGRYSGTGHQQRQMRTNYAVHHKVMCPHCPRRFRDRYNLRVHLRTHPEEEGNEGYYAQMTYGGVQMQQMQMNTTHTSPYPDPTSASPYPDPTYTSPYPDPTYNPPYPDPTDTYDPDPTNSYDPDTTSDLPSQTPQGPSITLRCQMCEMDVNQYEFFGHMKGHAEELEKESKRLEETLDAYKKCCATAEVLYRDS